VNGGAGGTGQNNNHGGYGGGGCGWFNGGNGGGGGGYSGGGTDGNYPSTYFGGGGGGGSYNIGTNQTNTAGFKTGNGLVVITPLVVAPTATIAQNATIQCFGQSTASLTATVTGGSSPYTYSWAPSGGNAATATGLAAGTYTVTVTDANSATTTQTFSITEPTALVASTMQTNVTCNGGTNGDAMVMVSGGTPSYQYSWAPSGGNAATASGLGAGTYTCTITDANGCVETQTVSITEPTALVASTMQTNVTCNGGTNGDAMVMVSGGSPNYQYSWAPSGGNAATANGLGAGTYTCTITDANGCVATQTVSITEPSALIASATSTAILCSGDSSTITVTASGGVGPYAGTGVFTVASGVHIYNISDANGCNTTLFDTITSPDPIVVSAAITNVSCNGGSNGLIDLTVNGGTPGYTFLWSNNATTEDLTGLSAGSYSGMVTDANGCIDSGTVVITEPAVLFANSLIANPTTCGGTDGSINVVTSGGTPAYTYLWSNNATTEDLSGLGAGFYSCTTTDSLGCATTFSVTLTDPNPPAVTFNFQQATICESDASITMSGSPAGGSFSGPGVTGNSFDPSALNGSQQIVYSYTDPNTLCSASSTATIIVNPCVGINDPTSSAMFVNIYPNPNAGMFTIEARSQSGNELQIELFNELGQTVQSFTMIGTSKSMDISTLDAGMYFIRISDGSSVSMQRIIKQ
ncbi:MAG: T9SS type A sorting domain-containing protein, partial [Bacteroidia bacterium]